jgi:hypothetical protein
MAAVAASVLSRRSCTTIGTGADVRALLYKETKRVSAVI